METCMDISTIDTESDSIYIETDTVTTHTNLKNEIISPSKSDYNTTEDIYTNAANNIDVDNSTIEKLTNSSSKSEDETKNSDAKSSNVISEMDKENLINYKKETTSFGKSDFSSQEKPISDDNNTGEVNKTNYKMITEQYGVVVTDDSIADGDQTDKPDSKAEVQIKTEQEDDEYILRKFSFSGKRERKKTELYVADETCVRKRKPPPETPIKKVDKVIKNHCGICKRVFENEKALFNHHNSIHKSEVKVFKCLQCNSHCNDNKQLKDHKECHKDDTFMCNKCELAYDNHCDFWMHSVNHLPQKKSYTCEECQKVLFDKKSLKTHIKSHYNIYIKCNICNQSVSRTELNAHKASHEEIRCVECGKICKGQRHYTTHMNSHIGYKPYQCLYCGKGFINACGRNTHTNIHLGIKKFKCNLCPHEAMQYTDLMRHKEAHSKERKFECNICHKKFLHSDYLKKHMRLHTGELLLKCPECTKAFISKTELRSHIVYAHTRTYDFKCEICDYSSMTKAGLLKHFKSVRHKQNQYGFDNKDK